MAQAMRSAATGLVILYFALAAAASAVAEPTLLEQMIAAVRELETHRYQMRRSLARIEDLRQAFNNLRNDQPRDAIAIRAASAKLATAMELRAPSLGQVSALETRLASLRAALPVASATEQNLLNGHLAWLAATALRRARIAYQIEEVQRQLHVLRNNAVKNTSAIANRMDALGSLQVERAATVAELTAAADDFQDFATYLMSGYEPPITSPNPGDTGPIPTPPGSGGSTARLHWSVPTSRADGSPILYHDIEGYVIRVAADAIGELHLPVSHALTTSFTFHAPHPGTYTFAIAAKDVRGHLGPFSTAVPKIFH